MTASHFQLFIPNRKISSKSVWWLLHPNSVKKGVKQALVASLFLNGHASDDRTAENFDQSNSHSIDNYTYNNSGKRFGNRSGRNASPTNPAAAHISEVTDIHDNRFDPQTSAQNKPTKSCVKKKNVDISKAMRHQ